MSDYATIGLDPDVKKFLNFMGGIVGAATYWMLRAMGVPMWPLLGMFIGLGICSAIGWAIGRVLSHRIDGDSTGVQITAWSLLIAWVFPGLGVLLSCVVYELANAASNRKYLLVGLSLAGSFASLVNGAWGVWSAAVPH